MEKNNIQNYIDKILSSPLFANKEVMKGLLKYLYESSEKGLTLKENDLAVDFFKRGNNFVPGDDTIVRVNIHKLRTLLDTYYQNEGRKDNLIIEIPKGGYAVKVVDIKQKKALNIHGNTKFIIGVLVLSVGLNLFWLIKSWQKKPLANNPVWADYIASNKPVQLILCDPFFYRLNDSLPETMIVRDVTINSTDELMEAQKKRFPKEKLNIKNMDYPYFSANNVRPLPDIMAVFAHTNKDIRLQALSETSTDDIKRNNCIFLANINSLRHISKFLEQTGIRLHTNPRQIVINKGRDSIVLSVPEFIHGYYTDYAFIVKLPGPENNILTIMGDFHGSGISGLTNFITREPFLSQFKKKVSHDYGSFPEYFEMVVKVTSYNYANFKTEVIYFKPE